MPSVHAAGHGAGLTCTTVTTRAQDALRAKAAANCKLLDPLVTEQA